MNRNAIILGLIVIILVALGVWYFYSSNMTGGTAPGATATTSASTNTAGNPTATAPAVPKTFRSIFTQSGNHQCTYELVATSTRNSSMIDIADGKMHGEFRTTGSITSANIMIYDGGYLYTWKEGTTAGKKTSIKSLADLPQVIPTDLTSGAIFGTSVDNVSWDCHDWVKDPKVFVIPTYVKFSTS